MKKDIINTSKIIIIALFIGLGANYISAAFGPLSTPPNCVSGNPGCDAPVNVSGSLQTKTGPLNVNGAMIIGGIRSLTNVITPSLQVTGGVDATAPGSGKVLTSDGSGNATWGEQTGNMINYQNVTDERNIAFTGSPSQIQYFVPLTFTPSSLNSKFMISAHIILVGDSGCNARLVRTVGTTNTTLAELFASSITNNDRTSGGVTYVDKPNIIGPVTYRLKLESSDCKHRISSLNVVEFK